MIKNNRQIPAFVVAGDLVLDYNKIDFAIKTPEDDVFIKTIYGSEITIGVKFKDFVNHVKNLNEQ